MKTTLQYHGAKLREISFPLGGIGSGCIGLGGDGRLKEWEIFNKPNKTGLNGFSHFAIRAEKDGKVIDARVLNGDLAAPYTGQTGNYMWRGFGHGPFRETLAGIPHFEDVTFVGEFPFAQLSFADKVFPGQLSLTAFNPFIPMNAKDSSLPAAFFTIHVKNTTSEPLNYTIAGSVSNHFPIREGLCTLRRDENGFTYLVQSSSQAEPDDVRYGDITLATDAKDVSIQQYWYRGRWYDNLAVFWSNFSTIGPLQNRVYDAVPAYTDPQGQDTCTIAAPIHLEPGGETDIRFIIAWSFPNNCNYWNKDYGRGDGKGQWKNYYATLFHDSADAARYALQNWKQLEGSSRVFCDTLFSQTLPAEVIDAVSANISILKSPTCWRLEDGSFYGWEGCHTHSGSCEGSCTHVWNYAYALPFLFPELERSMRENDFNYNMDKNGGMQFRLMLPLGSPRCNFRPCCDGQFGGIIKTYRDWKISGDDAWLRKLWPMVKQSLEYAWSPANEDGWDADCDGVLEGRQHHTLDMELFGPSSWLNSMYLAALKAGAIMAEHLGDTDSAEKYRTLFEKGSAFVNSELFNGEYFFQKIDLNDRSILDPYVASTTKSLTGDTVYDAYWNDEAKELKCQIGEGCMIDQVLGQWHADMSGLGTILDDDKVLSALHAIHRYNYKPDMRRHVNPCRMYFMADESATVICEWPEGKQKPVIAAPYSEESFHGMEYQVASHMIRRGMLKEGLDVVRAVRQRYDGERRNPWNEIECGSNYARSMASYALVVAYSGFSYDLCQGRIGFHPVQEMNEHHYFWSVGNAWGSFRQAAKQASFTVTQGSISIQHFGLDHQPEAVLLNGAAIPCTWQDSNCTFATALDLKAGDTLTFTW